MVLKTQFSKQPNTQLIGESTALNQGNAVCVFFFPFRNLGFSFLRNPEFKYVCSQMWWYMHAAEAELLEPWNSRSTHTQQLCRGSPVKKKSSPRVSEYRICPSQPSTQAGRGSPTEKALLAFLTNLSTEASLDHLNLQENRLGPKLPGFQCYHASPVWLWPVT